MLFLLLIFYLFNLKNLQSKDLDNILIQSDYAKKDKEISIFKGDVLLKKTDIVFSSDEFNFLKINKNESNNPENQLFFTDKPVKILLDDGTYIFGSKIFYNSSKNNSYLNDIQLFPGDDGISFFARKAIEKDDEVYILEDCILSSCIIPDKELEKQREEIEKNGMYKINEIQEPKHNLVYRNGLNKTEWSYILNPWSVYSSEIEVNKNTRTAYLKNVVFRLGPIPIFYFPYLSFNMKEVQSGVMPPRLTSLGLRQQGIEIPIYFRISNNIDLIISRSQYFSIPGLSSQKTTNDPTLMPLDFQRMRESSFGLDFRHLISNEYGYQNYYRFTGLLTDRTQLINDSGLGKLDSNGYQLMGYRGFLKAKSFIAFRENLFLNIDWTYISDPNILYIYKMNYTPYLRNRIQLNYVEKNSFHSIEIVEYRQTMMRFNQNIVPQYMPIIRSMMQTNLDFIGGKFFYDFQSSYINTQSAYNHFQARIKTGYDLSYIFNNGIKLSANFTPYLEFHNLTNISTNQTAIAPNFIGINGAESFNNNSLTYSNVYVLGNYAYILNSPQFLGTNMRTNFTRQGFQSNIMLNYILISNSNLGTTIIDPKIGIRVNQAFFDKNTFINDTYYLFTLNYYNFYETFRSGGLSIYDYGISPYGGLNLKHEYSHDIFFFAGGAIQNNIYNPLGSYVTSFSGLNSIGFSNFVGEFGFNVKGAIYKGNYRLDIKNGTLLELNQVAMINLFNGILNVGVYQMFIAREASFFNREISTLGLSTRINIMKNLFIQSSFGFNLSEEATINFPNGKTGITNINSGIFYRHSCFVIGFIVNANFFTVGNIGNLVSYTFKFQPIIKFETKIKPGNRKLPNNVFTEEDM